MRTAEALSAASPSAESLVAAAYVAQHLGLNFPAERQVDLERGLDAAARRLGVASLRGWLASLLRRKPLPHERDALAEALTVRETYFFREQETFSGLAAHILPELIEKRRAQGHLKLRLWSAGCATGEEAYSLAILLDNLIDDLSRWDVTILATDINATSLDAARQGVFRNWSFRGVPAALRARYFHRRTDGRFAIADDIRRRVHFEILNLAETSYPSPPSPARAIDVILCRNVLLYFERQQSARCIERMAACLAPGGWLVTGAAEYSALRFKAFETVRHGSATFYRKRRDGDDYVPSVQTVRDAVVPGPRAPAVPAVEPSYQSGVGTCQNPLVLRARASADRGEYEQALHDIDEVLAADRTDAGVHYLQATVLLELGEPSRAALALDRAIFLDADFVLALCMRALIAHDEKDRGLSRRYLENALAALEGRRSTAVVAGSTDITVGDLVDLMRDLRERIDA